MLLLQELKWWSDVGNPPYDVACCVVRSGPEMEAEAEATKSKPGKWLKKPTDNYVSEQLPMRPQSADL